MKKLLILLLILLSIFIVGCVNTTLNGRHYGQITAIEDNGLIFKTTTVYVKTDIISSQEDEYCLDKSKSNYLQLRNSLEEAAQNREKITILFHSEGFVAPWRCSEEPAIIDGIEK